MNKKMLGSVASSHRTPPTETVLQYRFAALLSQYLLQKTHYHRAAFQANIIPHFRVSHVVGGSFSKRCTACHPMFAGFNTFFGVGSHAFQNSFRCLQVSSGVLQVPSGAAYLWCSGISGVRAPFRLLYYLKRMRGHLK